ncbi:unnamed protein product [Hermetia illucens]|uniref:AAA+ ATPase domain-containing protein n=1 Tax=Hermetia illucens TaxID=343691 RepID=A0A7R8YLM0_HERIL|nr:unnamed protein product [Hermetia illucens]
MTEKSLADSSLRKSESNTDGKELEYNRPKFTIASLPDHPKKALRHVGAAGLRCEAAPFHIPHKKCLTKYESSSFENKDIIVGLREFPPTSGELKVRKLQAKPKLIPKKQIKLHLDETKLQESIDAKKMEQVKTTKKLPPPTTDLNKLIEEKVSKFTDDSFVYLTYTVPKSSEYFTPYSLIEVPYEKVDKTQFFTASRYGVTFWSRNENHFTNLREWQKEFAMYCKITKIPSFYNFRIWKGFKVWQKTIKWKKYNDAKRFLEDNLFYAIPPLAKCLLTLRREFCRLREIKFVEITNIEEWHLFYFNESQMQFFEATRAELRKFRTHMRDHLFDGCMKALIAKGFSPDDEALLFTSSKKLREAMSFTERAKKRRYCKLLCNFLTYCDHMVLTLCHRILRKSFNDYSMAFDVHDKLGPPLENLDNLALDVQIEEPRPEKMPKNPFFLAELVLKPDKVEVDPSENVMLHIVQQFENLMLEAMDELRPYTNDAFFNQFTEPKIMGRQEDRLSGNPPGLGHILETDIEFQDYRVRLDDVIHNAYWKAEKYIKRFEPIRINFEIDKPITYVTDIAALRSYCERYHKNMGALEGILSTVNLGLLKLKQGTFKEAVTPVCRDLLSVLESHLPKLATEKVAEIMEKANDLMTRLTFEPQSTHETVTYLHFLEETGKEIDEFYQGVDYAHDLYIIMKDFSIFAEEEEKEKYMDCEDLVIECKEVLAERQSQRQVFINRLAEFLQTDIQYIFDEIREVLVEIQNFKYIDKNSNREDIKAELESLMSRLKNCQMLSQEYRGYQKKFRIDVTRYDELEQALQEVRTRQALWDSIEEWEASLKKWTTANFHTLDVEELIDVNSRTLKNCTQFEKYLPPNELVPVLKESAELFREKLPIITCLRNPTLKSRHWIRIEQILQRKVFQEPSVTLATFEEAGAFSEELELELTEISGQASGESGLELQLKKIENIWKETELSVVPHRDAKDVFILAGIDELQAVLDETNIYVNTIAASRHVGPIKHKVEEWVQLLDLFAKTFEEWVACQQSWMYLEAIFSAADIQRQLPKESRMFLIVDKNWKEIMRNAYKMPLALPVMTDLKNYNTMKENNNYLDSITRCLEAYLEVKRMAFPRFYFLSNDELLEILAQTRNPHAVQPHLRKCFDAIARLEFGSKEAGEGGKVTLTNDIVSMISPEGEKIQFGKGLKARGPVEDWLSKVEDAMFIAVKRCMKFAFLCYPAKDRADWFQEHPNQVVLTVSQQQWAAEVHTIFAKANVLEEMKSFERKLLHNLAVLAAITRRDISPLLRKVLCALITIDVHAKDTITNLVAKQVSNENDFDWLKMIRFYWSKETETMYSRMASACLPYFYEYLGAGGVLVITPLTDRCYLCLMGALQMDLGGAPAGPAGTGKTETTKDLAKTLAKQCVVFNCSEGLDYKMMGRFFSGLAQCGAWCCFDEFNRIDIEVLSVIAQQLITIRNAKASKLRRFMFEGREIKLDHSCAVFITMNPGYAGRTELPDNLKALFRPISMMVPDYALISEVILYSEGFEEPKILAHKMVQMYKLCSEQLSQQNHYDFGMRAVKSVLVMAGSLKRSAPNQREDITLIAALRDANLPKFLADDAILFKGILSDLFPGVELPVSERGDLEKTITECIVERNMQAIWPMINKCIQLYETMVVRWGVMLVGPTGGGKTSVLNVLACALTKLFEEGVQGPQYRPVNIQTLNPKSVTLDELYGAVNTMTLEWKDGLLGLAVRYAGHIEDEIHQWIVCDGPVDAVWIENMNTVLDDNKMLCLANSERIKLTPWVHMVFEVQDLAQASPATVSRCGMVYIDPNELGWEPLVLSWRDTIKEKTLKPDHVEFVIILFKKYFGNCLNYSIKTGVYAIHQVVTSKVSMCCELLTALFDSIPNLNFMDETNAKRCICKLYVWASLWSIGGNFDDDSRYKLENKFKELLAGEKLLEFPTGNIWDFRVNITSLDWEHWNTVVEPFNYNINDRFFDMLVPTTDTTKFGYISELLFLRKRPVMFTGDTGVGKSVLAESTLKKLGGFQIVSHLIHFSAQTSSARTQEMIEARLEKKRKGQLGAPVGKTLIMFIDDVNMPKLDTYGSQPPIELLRQFLDFKGFYEREKMTWVGIVDVILGAACAPPGGGRNPLTPRFVRHFALLSLSPPADETLTTIFRSILDGFFSEFNRSIQALATPIVKSCVEVYGRIAHELLPTPDKSHYVFNLRDLSKCIQGILQSDSSNYTTERQMLRLYYHESMRVFHDRLINDHDKNYFKQLISETCVKNFGDPVVQPDEVLLFGDFMIFGQAYAERIYEEIKDLGKLQSILVDYLEDYATLTGQEMKLILFQDAMEHIVRLARLLRSDRGNGLLVGVSGNGKQSLTKLSSHINGYRCNQIELTRGYDSSNFHDDLRVFCRQAGVNHKPNVFLIVDTQIVKEEFLEDINNILNSGEVPNLFEADDYEKVILDTREACNEAKKKDCTREEIFEFFNERVRNLLHLVICMSPIGEAFRRRCRMFPSLVNCCTIDWFESWPPEALYSVALGLFEGVIEDQKERESLAKTSVYIHKTVEEAALTYYAEMRRRYYTTPSSYLELLKLYKSLLKKRTDIIIAKRERLANGLNKILETNDVVAVMQKDLETMVPQLDLEAQAMKDLLAKLEVDTKNADVVKEAVSKDETIAKDKAAVSRAIADDAAKDLEIAMPALKEAETALSSLNKTDINELRAFANPPELVQFVMESVCILLGVKPNWASAKSLMADVNFLKRLFTYDKEHIPEATIKKLKKYIEHKDFIPAKIEKVSKVAKSVCLWVIAIDKFSKVYKVVEPKIKKHKAAEDELSEVMAVLRTKQQQLAEVEAKIQALKDNIEEKNRQFQKIQDNVNLTAARINRAGRLTSALSDEEVRWGDTIKKLSAELWSVPGDVLIASACVAYLGAFSISYRRSLTLQWVAECQKHKIPSSSEFNLINILGDPYEMRSWNMQGLPKDDISVENGLYVTRALRWPLMIDPQEQANQWIRNLEKGNNLRILKMNDPHLSRILEICVRQGYPLLIEDIGEEIDPTLNPILQRLTFIHEGRPLIKLGDTAIDYDQNFKLYMTTKLPNPHYLPEVCITVTLVNFLVTVEGLEDQLLANVVEIELPELEKQRSDLVVKINKDRQMLLSLEDRVLQMLFSSKGNILDDEELVEALNESKETSLIIAARLVDTEQTEQVITAKREKYRPLAARGAVIYFVVASLAEIDPMYQYSLKYFTQIFSSVISVPHAKMPTDERIKTLKMDELKAIFENVSRGLFEKHKLVFSFLLATTVEKQEGIVTDAEFDFLIRGPIGSGVDHNRPEEFRFLSDSEWTNCAFLEFKFKSFSGIKADIRNKIALQVGDHKESLSFFRRAVPSNIPWNDRLTNFHKLMLIKAFKKDKLVPAIGSYIRQTLDRTFTETSSGSSLNTVYFDTSNITPLIFILSTGSDPMAAFLKFTEEMKFMDKFYSISLGQGQGPAAESLVEKGRALGHWVFLQNCHLATSWMGRLENIVRDLALGITTANPDFRLYLSSMPTASFPISVLQNSVKVTNEPPKGLKANVTRALADMDTDFFEQHVLNNQWRALVFGLCMFHAVVLERRKFGPLGWNILYEFNESDRDCGLKTLDMFINREKVGKIPWEAILYINGEITWGGRVTDCWDQRCLKTILKIFSSSVILQDGYTYGESNKYRDPRKKTLADYKEFTSNLPFDDDPEIFGMHENANIVFQTNETEFFIMTILEGQPRASTGAGQSKDDETCLVVIKDVSKALARSIIKDDPFPSLVKLDDKGRMPSLTTVLMQEIDRYNILLNIIHSDLANLEKAIKGLVVMSEELENIFKALISNLVPAKWSSKGFLSIKFLSNWVFDFQRRIDYIQTWQRSGLPRSSWLSGVYFPQSFLTGILQTHARKHNLPIDSLKIDFQVLPVTLIQQNIYEKHMKHEEENKTMYGGLDYQPDGINVHGLFIEAGRWDHQNGGLVDARVGELYSRLPVVWFKPCLHVDVRDRYEAPLYKTQSRAGVLSTTGHSTNFVLPILLESKQKPDFWILRGTALVTAVSENVS